MSNEFKKLFIDKGIVSQFSCPYTPQQNGVVEHKNFNLLDVTRALLIDFSVPSNYQVEALFYVVYLINRLSSKLINLESP